MLPAPPRCEFPGCEEFPMHRHHVTYHPEVIKRLCVRHHEEITIINGIQGRKYRTSLSNTHRWWIWHQWLEGKLKPRKTQKAMEYIEDMRRGPRRVIAVEIEPVPEREPLPTTKARRTPQPKKAESKTKRKLTGKQTARKSRSDKMKTRRKGGGRREKAN